MTYQAKIYGGGKIAIPADVRRELGIKDGDTVSLDVDGGKLTISTLDQVVRDTQAYFRGFVPEGVSLADELIADRRAEAARDRR